MRVFVKKQVFYNHLVFLERTLPKEGEMAVRIGDLVKAFDVLGHTYLSRLAESVPVPKGAKIMVRDEEAIITGQVLFKKSGFVRREAYKAQHGGIVGLRENKIEVYSQPEKFNLVSGIEAKVAKVIEKILPASRAH